MINGLTIKQLKLQNFFAYEEVNIMFSQSTIISGKDNGVGKTTIAEAIYYALTGKFLRNIKDDEAIRQGSNEMIVEIDGIYKNEFISIIRIYDGKTTLEIMKGDPVQNVINTKEFLSQVINEIEFATLIYINGHDMEYIINQTDASRSKLLDKMFGIDTITKIIDNIKPNLYLRNYEMYVKNIEDRTNIYNETKKVLFDSNKEFYQLNLNELKEKRAECINKLEETQDKINKIEKQKNSMDKLEEKYRTDLENKEKLEILLRGRARNISLINSIKNHLLDNETIDDALNRIKNNINTKTKAINSQSTIFKASNEIIKYIHEKKLSQCPICKTKLTNSNIQTIPLDKMEISELKDLESKYYELNLIKTQLIPIKVKDIDKKYELISKRIQTHEYYKEKFNLNYNEYNNISNQKKLLEQQIQVLDSNIKNVIDKLNTINIVTSKSDYLIRLENEIEKNKKLSKHEYKKYEIAQKLKSNFNELLSLLRSKTLDKLNPSIQIFIDMMTKHCITKSDNKPLEFKLIIDTKETRKNNYVIYKFEVKRFNEYLSFNNLSTGQKAICTLALLLSLLNLLHPNLNLVIFDEIHTSGIDQNANNELMDAIIMIAKHLNILFIDRDVELCKSLNEKMLKNDIDSIVYTVFNEENTSKIH